MGTDKRQIFDLM